MVSAASRRRFVVPFCVVLAGALAGCGGSGSDANGAKANRVSVVATFYPLAWMAEQIGGPAVKVSNLTPPGVEPHDLELTPDQVDSLTDADVAIVLGRGFQPGPEKVAKDRSKPTVVALDTAGIEDGPVAEEGSSDGIDPHVWLDPVAFSKVRSGIVDALAKARPAEADAFRRRSEELGASLSALDGELKAGLATCARKDIVTNHDAFGRLAARYGLTQEGIAGLSPDAEPDPQRLAQLADLVKSKGVTTIFTEELAPTAFADTLARETGAATATLSPLEGLTADELAAGDSYFTVMRSNLAALRTALSCS